jgi:acetoin utilization deacetylase AcuC-like enzyme
MTLKVAVVRDERFLLHNTGLVHPERPGRLKAVYRMLDKEFPDEFISIEPELATLEQLELVHTPGYIQKILRTAEREFTNLAPDTPVNSESYLSAFLAVGGCIRGLQALLSGRCEACFVLSRPPGHHALPARAGGFCIFNNIGIAARYAMERHGLRRIMILDWDIHHGNGIQELFYDQQEVLYLSTHNTGWYPFTGDWNEIGVGAGLGYTVNIPVPKDIADEDLVYLYTKVLQPVLRRFKPELILIAAGFDGHHRDPIGRTHLTERVYGLLTELVIELRDAVRSPPILLALEGGYDVGSLAGCVREVLQALSFKGRRSKVAVAVTPRGKELADKAHGIHAQYRVWTE